jgi:hypothetical protein
MSSSFSVSPTGSGFGRLEGLPGLASWPTEFVPPLRFRGGRELDEALTRSDFERR